MRALRSAPTPPKCVTYLTTCSATYLSQSFQVQMMTRLFNPRELQGTQPVSLSTVPGKYEAIRLPYKGSPGLAAVFVLPSRDTFPTVADAAKQIGAQMALDDKAWVPLSEPLVLSLPRFRAEVKQLRLKEVCRPNGSVGKGAVQSGETSHSLQPQYTTPRRLLSDVLSNQPQHICWPWRHCLDRRCCRLWASKLPLTRLTSAKLHPAPWCSVTCCIRLLCKWTKQVPRPQPQQQPSPSSQRWVQLPQNRW